MTPGEDKGAGGEAGGAGQVLLESSVCRAKQLSFLPAPAPAPSPGQGRSVAREGPVVPKETLHKDIRLLRCESLEGMGPSGSRSYSSNAEASGRGFALGASCSDWKRGCNQGRP